MVGSAERSSGDYYEHLPALARRMNFILQGDHEFKQMSRFYDGGNYLEMPKFEYTRKKGVEEEKKPEG